MNTLAPGQVWYLLKFLLFPTRLLGFFAILMVLGLVAAGLTYTHDIRLASIFYLPAAILFTFLLMGLTIQFSLLAHRKTLVLCGPFSAYLILISALVLGAWCLVIAAAVIPPMENFAGFWRMSTIIAALLSLGIFLGVLTRLILFLIAFVLLAVTPSEAFFSVLGSAYQQGSVGHYSVFLALTTALWICLYQRLKRARIPAPLGEVISAGARNKTPMGNPLGRLLPTLRLGERLRNPGRILLLESRYPWLAYFVFSLFLAMAGTSILALFFILRDEPLAEVYRLVSGGLVLASALLYLGSVETVGANLRRLWLLTPGSRADLFRRLERSLLVTAAAVVLPFALASAGLLNHAGEPLWWSLSWALYIVLILALLSYLLLLTLGWEHFGQGLFRLLMVFALMFITTMFWVSRNPAFAAGVIVALIVAVPILRALALSRWRRMDYSLLKNRVTRL